jgi:hypothetical protein
MKEALEIREQLDDTTQQAEWPGKPSCLVVTFRQQNSTPQKQSRVPCGDRSPPSERRTAPGVRISSRALGYIHRSNGDTEKAVHRFELALGIASPDNRHMSPLL